MKSIILCEGSTDFALLQYFLREAYHWIFGGELKTFKNHFNPNCVMDKDGSTILLGGCGGCSRLIPNLEFILDRNSISAETEAFDKIVLITDRDEVETEADFISIIELKFRDNRVSMEGKIKNNQWTTGTYENGHGKTQKVQFLLMVIPFEETGAMETFLLDSIAASDPYDAQIIQDGNDFVNSVDNERRYLTKRRYITKAKFDVYFSIRTAVDQFTQRQNIIRNVQWEKYTKIQESFKKLGELS